MSRDEPDCGDALYSGYSLHFKSLDPALYAENKAGLETPLEALRLRLDLALIARHAKGPDLLDFPIGTGRIYPHLMERFTVHGYDICEPYIAEARAAHPEIAERFQVSSFERLDRSRRFDSVVSLRTLDGIKDLDAVLPNLAAILKPGGRWLFTLALPDAEVAGFKRRLEAAGLRLAALERYDIHATSRAMGPRAARLYGYWRALIARGWVPYGAFRLVDRLFARRGTGFFVAERPPEAK